MKSDQGQKERQRPMRTQDDPAHTERPFFLFNKVFLSSVIVIAIVGIAFSTSTPTGADDSSSQTKNPSIFRTIKNIVVSGDKELKGEAEDRINILLLGVGGTGHDGPQLSDTIIFSSLRPSTNEIGMLSIPRDLNVPIDGYGWRKINHLNAYGEQDNPGEGALFASNAISDILNKPIHYYVRIDFSGFEDFIESIGGVDIYVERDFIDTTYPIDDGLGSVTTLEFEEGWEHMNGERALQYARSRHGTNFEGSDFARAARQQKVLLAVKKKVLSAGTLLNPGRIAQMISTLSHNINTNIQPWEILRLANMAKAFDTETINNVVLDTRPGSPLFETVINGAYVILPKNDDWEPISDIAENVFDVTDITTVARTENTGEVEPVRVEIQNGTEVTGLAFNTSQRLAAQGIEVVTISNATQRDWERTTIYDLSSGERNAELTALRDYLDADVSQSIPTWLSDSSLLPDTLSTSDDFAESQITGSAIDFLVILGQSSANLRVL